MLIYSIQLQVVREMARNASQQAFSMQDNTNVGGATQFSRNVHLGGYDPANTVGGVLFDFMRKTYHRSR